GTSGRRRASWGGGWARRAAMTPQRYERLCELFDRARQRPPGERAAFLEGACAGDPSLRAEVESLLAHDQRARGEGLLQGPCPVNARALLPAAEAATSRTAPPAGEPDDALLREGLLAHDRGARGEGPFPGPCPVDARPLPPADGPATFRTGPPAADPDDALVGRRVGPYLIEQRV